MLNVLRLYLMYDFAYFDYDGDFFFFIMNMVACNCEVYDWPPFHYEDVMHLLVAVPYSIASVQVATYPAVTKRML